MVPLSKVQDLIAKHSKLEKELSSQEIDKKSFAEKSKEYSDLSDIIKEAVSYFNFQKNKGELEIKLVQSDKRSGRFLCSCQTSPFGPLPYFGGSSIIPSYDLPRLISR